MRRALGAIPRRGEILAVYIEAPWIGPSPQMGIQLAMMIGSVWQAVDRTWPDALVEFVQPQSWKRVAGVEPDPKPNGKKLGHVSLARAALEHAKLGSPNFHVPTDWEEAIVRAAKPFVYLRALELGFAPHGSQDAADAACLAVAGAMLNAEIVKAAG